MNTVMSILESMGFRRWFQERVDTEAMLKHDIARVVAVHKGGYMVSNGRNTAFAELTGRLTFNADSAADLPTTGDWVYVDFYDDDTHAIIHEVFPRKTLLKRKTPGKSVDFQLIAANIDTAFIVQSMDYNFNPRRLERYLVMINESRITPVILLSKCDLVSATEREQIIQQARELAAEPVIISFSNETGINLDRIQELLLPGHTCCLLGSSGVGKTTLLNNILGHADFATRPVSKKENKGRHTTTSRELVQLDNGAIIIDTPGMRELGNLSVDDGLEDTFSEIVELAGLCRFSDCTHSTEKGCAIRAAIESGTLSEERYRNYLKMKAESAFNEMSYLEKRQKDRRFGKMIKTVMKNKKR